MSNNDQDIWVIITSVLDNSASLEEHQRFNEWLSESEVNRKTYEVIANTGFRKKEVTQGIKNEVFQMVLNETLTISYIHKIRIWKYSVAASLAIILALGASLLYMQSSISSIAKIETSASFGNKSKVILSDGSAVYLNSGSTISYPAQFTGGKREVTLNGEAYFEVAKDARHPFIVHADAISIKVLGTHFNVKNYRDNMQIVATLLEGKIDVSKPNNTLIEMKPNQQVSFNKRTGKTEMKTVEADLYIKWKENEYYFEDETFTEIARELERGFNIKIKIVSDRLKSETFSGVFDKGETIMQILEIMKRHRSFTYSQKDNTIEILEN